MKLVLVLIHVAVCIALIMIVLLQKGKGAGMGAAFGGSSQTVFGSGGGASFMHKITAASAIIFMLTCLGLALISGKGSNSSIMEGVGQTTIPATQQSQDAIPAPSTGGQAE